MRALFDRSPGRSSGLRRARGVALAATAASAALLLHPATVGAAAASPGAVSGPAASPAAMSGPAASPGATSGPTTPPGAISPATSPAAVRAEAARASAAFAVARTAPHAGTAETLTHPAADGLDAGGPGLTPTRRADLVTRPGAVLTGPTGLLGIDVADYQGDVDWSAIAADGGRFAYVKATQGTSYVDTQYFDQQYDGSYDAGLLRGAYHFAVPDQSTGRAQAAYFVANGGGWSADGRTLPGMLDIENNPYGSECYGLSRAAMVAWVRSFDGEYEALTGRFPVLYTNASWWDTCTGGSSVADRDPLDVAAWGPSPSPLPVGWATHTFWQYTDANRIGTDGDEFDGSRAALVAFALDSASVPAAQLASGGTLTAGQRLLSSSGRYELVMQADGNLVEYAVGGRALWSSGTAGHPGARLAMQADGNLVVYAGAKAVWSTRTHGDGASRVVVQGDANVVVYDAAGRATWASGTEGR